MGFLLPVLLLGLSQPPDQSTDLSAQHEQTQADVSSHGILARKFAFNGARSVIHDLTDAPRTGCLTMRSYYFERHDRRAPEFVGMTTCEPVRKFTTKKIGRPARLVPAN